MNAAADFESLVATVWKSRGLWYIWPIWVVDQFENPWRRSGLHVGCSVVWDRHNGWDCAGATSNNAVFWTTGTDPREPESTF
jgi:hypothetical protein